MGIAIKGNINENVLSTELSTYLEFCYFYYYK